MHLIGDDVRRVERILFVRVPRQRVQRDRPAEDVPVRDRVFHRISQDTPSVFFGLFTRGVQAVLQHILPIVEGLQCLLERRAHDVAFRTRLSAEDAQRPRKRRDQDRLAVFAWDKNERLFHKAFVGALFVEYQDAVDDELLPRLQLERLTPQRLAVQRLALAVFERRLDQPDHEVGVLCSNVQIVALQKLQEPQTTQRPIAPAHDGAHDAPARVLQHLIGVLSTQALSARHRLPLQQSKRRRQTSLLLARLQRFFVHLLERRRRQAQLTLTRERLIVHRGQLHK